MLPGTKSGRCELANRNENQETAEAKQDIAVTGGEPGRPVSVANQRGERPGPRRAVAAGHAKGGHRAPNSETDASQTNLRDRLA